MKVLGIDIGGSGIKGAPVDIVKGEFTEERYRVVTPQPANPQNVAKAVKEVVDHFAWKGTIGVGFPSLISKGIILSAANIDKSWVGVSVVNILSEATQCPVAVLNDADAAGYAEICFGDVYKNEVRVLFLTVGTGIGSALFHDGILLPNTELGHLELKGKDAELYCADAVRKRKNLTRQEWAARFNVYLMYVESLFSPQLIILGGGSSKKFYKYKDVFTTRNPIKPASLLNNAGIIGAAVYAHEVLNK